MYMKHDLLVLESLKAKGPAAIKTAADLISYRKKARKTQPEFAKMLGMPLRTYQGLEYGTNPFRKVHRMALLYHMLKGDPDES